VGECFIWYQLTRVDPDKGRKTVVVGGVVVAVYLICSKYFIGKMHFYCWNVQ